MPRISMFIAVLAMTATFEMGLTVVAKAQNSAMDRCVAYCQKQGGKRCQSYCEEKAANRR